MKPVEFLEQNIIWAKNQPPYLPLPAFTDAEQTIQCWAMTWRERFAALWSGRVWVIQLNFGKPLNPQRVCVESPFATPASESTESAARLHQETP